MKKQSIPELDKLFQEVGTFRKSNEFKDLLNFIKRFPRIAPYNAMLLYIQKPGSEYVASATKWNRTFNRNIKPGARPLVTLRPFGPVAFVFELSDTYGDEPFPEKLLNPFIVKGKIPQKTYNNLEKNLICDGISLSESERGTSSADFIQKSGSKQEEILIRGKKRLIVKILYNMVVNSNHSSEEKFATIIHELGHVYCGHLGTPDPRWWSDRRNLTKNQEEFEAECICWLICERLGVKNKSAEYLNGYLNNNSKIPSISIDIVLKSVGMIESLINNGSKNPRKEIIIREEVKYEQQTFRF